MALTAQQLEDDLAWKAGVEAAASFLETAHVGPKEAAAHWSNAADAIRYVLLKQEPRRPRRRRRRKRS